jgi:hypothetical protein
MTAAHPTSSAGGTSCDNEGDTAALGLTDWLRLAATPTFATLALLTGLSESPMKTFCSSGHGAPLSGMAIMYLFMSAFHSPPWLNLIWGRSAPQSTPEARQQPNRREGMAVC